MIEDPRDSTADECLGRQDVGDCEKVFEDPGQVGPNCVPPRPVSDYSV